MKKEAKAAILKKLQEEQKLLRSKLANNRHVMARLVAEQTMAKRQLAEYRLLIRSLLS